MRHILVSLAILILGSVRPAFAGHCDEVRASCWRNCTYSADQCSYMCERAYELCLEGSRGSSVSTPRPKLVPTRTH